MKNNYLIVENLAFIELTQYQTAIIDKEDLELVGKYDDAAIKYHGEFATTNKSLGLF